MRTTDLMIGDWIEYNGKKYQVTYLKISLQSASARRRRRNPTIPERSGKGLNNNRKWRNKHGKINISTERQSKGI